ncbi:hypothetical protein BD769DRAFT_1662908 [Suillus cothurnatus]|nr:hypothetical protein BD769DRAFT_1662908 [Suillus cothurnatus]
MSFTFPENDFDPNGNFIASGGPEYFMGMLNENEGLSNTLQPWDDIDLDDPSLYMMPLTSDELAAVNGEPVLPHPTFIAEFSPDAHDLTPASRTPSPADSESLSEPLRDANLSTWAVRNPTRPVIHCRTPPTRLSDAQKASRKIKKGLKTEMTKRLHDAVVKHLQEQKHAVELLSRAHNRVNSDQPIGSRYTLGELREMVAEDPQMKNLTRDEKTTYVSALREHHEQKVSSVRANNIAAARDVLVTTERVIKELNDLRVRTGTYATVYVVRGHINDTIQSTMHGTDNSEDFWEDVYDSPMADVLRQYEQWACTQNQSQSSGSSLLFYFVLIKYLRDLNERDSLETVRKQARKLIVRGLVAVTGKKDITMNYNNYNTAIIETYAVKLVGWPQGVKFISPSNIRTVGEIRKLRDALKARTCYWAALTPAEVKLHTAELDACRSAGQVVRQPRKKRSDAGVARKCKAPPTTGQAHKENRRPSKKVKKNSSAQHREAPKSAEFIESSDEEEDEGE